MAVLTSTGTILSISTGQPATHDAAGFAALTFTEIGKVTNIPEFGASAQVVTLEPLATGITEKHKGFINYGSQTVEAAYDEADAGQVLVSSGVTGAETNTEFSVKLEYQDGSIRYYKAKIFSYTETPNSANSMVMTSIQMEINSTIVKVAAP